MSGHSKWATTKRAKAVVDAKRGATFTKLANLIIMNAKKGGDPVTNFSLRLAIDRARAANMPKDNIERAIKRGTGELAGAAIEELIYEGIGPAQSQFIVRCLTDSRNRAASLIRHIFDKVGGSLSAVMWNFELKGVIMVSASEVAKINFDELELELIDAGASDIINEAEGLTIYSDTANLQAIKKLLEEKAVAVESSEIEYVAKEKRELTEEEQEKIERF
ncbi:MAG TPA: YebC/PmpR family DNA-binding transcriptional regulator, partial [bacterium]|nr:YebC/PmpR family DNA-binding transcriptional regulator [bacterium]